ncbi:MAG TPA: hypothetical protein VGD78_10555 [Chthoniobacterales bacterium]
MVAHPGFAPVVERGANEHRFTMAARAFGGPLRKQRPIQGNDGGLEAARDLRLAAVPPRERAPQAELVAVQASDVGGPSDL